MSVLVAPDGRVRAFLRFLLGTGVALLANMVAATAANSLGGGTRRFDLLYRPLTMVLLIAGFSLLLVIADGLEGNPLPAMGLKRQAWLGQSLWGMLLGSGMVAVAVACIAVAGNVEFSIRGSTRLWLISAVELFILATAAMAEELMFRGYPFQRLVESMGPWPAALVLSGLFGLVHLWNPNASLWGFVNTVAVGVLLSLAYLRTRALWLPWGVHFGWNTTLGLIFGLPVSGLKDFAIVVRGTAQGPRWLTGGNYGIEASAVGTVVILAGLGLVATLARAPQEPRTEEAAAEPGGAARTDHDAHPTIEAPES